MNTDQLIAAIRMAGMLSDSDPDYDAARLRIEATDALTTVFEKPIVNARQGYWLQQLVTTTTTGKPMYPNR